jgi:hypothetical protein
MRAGDSATRSVLGLGDAGASMRCKHIAPRRPARSDRWQHGHCPYARRALAHVSLPLRAVLDLVAVYSDEALRRGLMGNLDLCLGLGSHTALHVRARCERLKRCHRAPLLDESASPALC